MQPRKRKRRPKGEASHNRSDGRSGGQDGRVIVIDAETDPFKYGRIPEPFIWGAYDGDEYWVFRETGELVKWLAEQSCVCYAHNGGRFDFHFLIPYVDDGDIMIIRGRLAKLRIGKCELRDSALIIPIALKKYKKDDIDYTLLERDNRDGNMAEIIAYLKSDCRYTWELITAWRDMHGDALTLAGAAMASLCELCDVAVPETTAAYHTSLAPWYRGGRCWCDPGVYEGPVELLDIVSAYPWSMSVGPHPWGAEFMIQYDPPPLKTINPAAFYRVTLDADGWLPYTDTNGRTIYPRGAREYHVTGHEMLALREMGISWNTVHEVRTPVQTINFKPFVDHYFKMKKEAPKDSPQYIIAKLTLNSGYGKFGSDPSHWKRYVLGSWGEGTPPRMSLQCELHGRPVYARALERYEEVWYDVAVAASVCGQVRAKLMVTIWGAGRPYCPLGDTDSILMTPKAKRPPISSELGGWEVEGRWSRAFAAGKKMYVLEGRLDGPEDKRGDKVRSKGVRLEADQIKAVCEGKAVEYRQNAPTFSIARGTHFVKREVMNAEERKRRKGRKSTK